MRYECYFIEGRHHTPWSGWKEKKKKEKMMMMMMKKKTFEDLYQSHGREITVLLLLACVCVHVSVSLLLPVGHSAHHPHK